MSDARIRTSRAVIQMAAQALNLPDLEIAYDTDEQPKAVSRSRSTDREPVQTLVQQFLLGLAHYVEDLPEVENLAAEVADIAEVSASNLQTFATWVRTEILEQGDEPASVV